MFMYVDSCLDGVKAFHPVQVSRLYATYTPLTSIHNASSWALEYLGEDVAQFLQTTDLVLAGGRLRRGVILVEQVCCFPSSFFGRFAVDVRVI